MQAGYGGYKCSRSLFPSQSLEAPFPHVKVALKCVGSEKVESLGSASPWGKAMVAPVSVKFAPFDGPTSFSKEGGAVEVLVTLAARLDSLSDWRVPVWVTRDV